MILFTTIFICITPLTKDIITKWLYRNPDVDLYLDTMQIEPGTANNGKENLIEMTKEETLRGLRLKWEHILF